jgi:hypothetical protein
MPTSNEALSVKIDGLKELMEQSQREQRDCNAAVMEQLEAMNGRQRGNTEDIIVLKERMRAQREQAVAQLNRRSVFLAVAAMLQAAAAYFTPGP